MARQVRGIPRVTSANIENLSRAFGERQQRRPARSKSMLIPERCGTSSQLWPGQDDLRKLDGSDDGDHQMVRILAAVITTGLRAVLSAPAQAMFDGVHSSGVILKILARSRDPSSGNHLTQDALTLRHAPVPDLRPIGPKSPT